MIGIPGLSIPRRRRAAAFSPLNISGLQLWLDASNLSSLYQDAARTTPVANDADVVGAMSDLSGNGRHATQSTTASKPTYRAAVQNGRGVVRFDGVDDVLSATRTATSVLSIFMVIRQRSSQVNRRMLALHTLNNADIFSTAAYAIGYFDSESAGAYSYGGNVSSWTLIGTVISATTSAAAYLNGSSAGTFDPKDTYASGTTLWIGAAGNSSGYAAVDVAEAILYNSALSTNDRQAVENYLNNKWTMW